MTNGLHRYLDQSFDTSFTFEAADMPVITTPITNSNTIININALEKDHNSC